jgi:carotenoid cleavage dioxygenase-like enzyme
MLSTTSSGFVRNMPPVGLEVDLVDMPVMGTLPPQLEGTLLRIGPNPLFPVEGAHWFAGDGMVHAFHLADGTVAYRNRWVRTARWLAERDAGRALAGGLEDTAGDGLANTNIVRHAGRLLALEEAHPPMALRLDGLATLGSAGFDGVAAGPVCGPFTAHPKLDPVTGQLLFFGYGTPDWLGAGMRFGVLDAAGRVERFDSFEAPYASLVHDFAVTANYVVFPVQPLTASRERLRAGGPAFAWEAERACALGVLRRDAPADTIAWWSLPACYMYHVMNAWEDGRILRIDVMQANAAALFPRPDGSQVADAGGARLSRWSIDLDDRRHAARSELLCEVRGEFPRIDERRSGLAYRHGWFVGHAPAGEAPFSRIVHIDHARPFAPDVHVLAEGDACSEAVFVPRVHDAEEGDGWLLAVAYRGASDTSDLLVFDARDVGARPLAGASLPVRVPNGFHGNWISV